MSTQNSFSLSTAIFLPITVQPLTELHLLTANLNPYQIQFCHRNEKFSVNGDVGGTNKRKKRTVKTEKAKRKRKRNVNFHRRFKQ